MIASVGDPRSIGHRGVLVKKSGRFAIRKGHPSWTFPPRGKEERKQNLKGPGNAEPRAEAPVVGVAREARRRADERGSAAPGRTTANDTPAVTSSCPCIAIRWCPIVVVVPAILRPLPNIAMHVMDFEFVGRKAADRCCVYPLIATNSKPVAAFVFPVIGKIVARLIAPPVFRHRSCAGHIFPFRFAQQTI